MIVFRNRIGQVATVIIAFLIFAIRAFAEEESIAAAAPTLSEARSRARVLHEAMHGVLQVMHRDFFREDEGLSIPSRSLEDVFKELQRTHRVELRWLAVDTEAMNVDHKPKTDFERGAVKAFIAGKPEFEETREQNYRYAGRIRLASQCLKCHSPNRTSTDDKSAALIISFPFAK